MNARRGGFTLVEVLAAMAISGALLLGLFGALDLSARYRTAGRDQAHCDRIANAAAQYFETTIREAPISLDGDLDSAFAPDVNNRAARAQDVIKPITDPVLIAGDETTLIVGTRNATTAAPSDAASRNARIITTESIRADALPGVWRRRTVVGSDVGRHRGRLSTLLLREVETATTLAPSRWEVEYPVELSEDVSRAKFRYFDGTAWNTRWDGDGRKRLQAVEVSFAARSGTVERLVQIVISTAAHGGLR
jgi:prepilin-type N-terminal cleavage/methylation domain-containing protein